MKRHRDHANPYKGKHLIGTGLQFRGLVHFHYREKQGGMQTGMMLGTKKNPTNYLNQERCAQLRFQDSLQKVSQAMTVLGETQWAPTQAGEAYRIQAACEPRS